MKLPTLYIILDPENGEMNEILDLINLNFQRNVIWV